MERYQLVGCRSDRDGFVYLAESRTVRTVRGFTRLLAGLRQGMDYLEVQDHGPSCDDDYDVVDSWSA